jgi:folate-binding protein YgfZ
MFSREQYRALGDQAGVTPLDGRGRLLLTGADRRTYLQGLLTNDIVALGAGTGCYAAFLTAQGRMITDMRVLELGDALLIDLPRTMSGTVRDRLAQFVFSEDVEIEDVSERWAGLGVYGPAASAVIVRAIERASPAPARMPNPRVLDALVPFGSTKLDFGGAVVVAARNDDYGVPGFDLYAEQTVAQTLAAALDDAGATAAAADTLDVLRIEAGVPAFGMDMDEDTIPLEAGIEDRAISLTKGCYVGQEIIIRVLHRGHGRVARRLVGLLMEPGAPTPRRGDRISRDGREIGLVTSAALSPLLGRAVALGYVHRDFAEAGTSISIAHGNGAVEAVVAALPFIRRGSG